MSAHMLAAHTDMSVYTEMMKKNIRMGVVG